MGDDLPQEGNEKTSTTIYSGRKTQYTPYERYLFNHHLSDALWMADLARNVETCCLREGDDS